MHYLPYILIIVASCLSASNSESNYHSYNSSKFNACFRPEQGPQGPIGEQGEQGPDGVQGETGADGPQGETGISETLYDFSATLSNFILDNDGQFSFYTTADPFYTDTGFNPITGIYTVPSTGKYAISAIVDFVRLGDLEILGDSVEPRIVLAAISGGTTTLLYGSFPIFDYDDTGGGGNLNTRVLAQRGRVFVGGDIILSSGTQIALFYEADGMTSQIQFGELGSPGVTWSIYSLFDE